MAKDDWFRLPCLTEAQHEEFENRLKRARSSRAEYMRIQAYALCEAKAYDKALIMLDRVLKDHPDHLTAWIFESRAECLRTLGQVNGAIEDYVQSIVQMRAKRGVVSNAPLRLASLACEANRPDIYEECLGYLTEFWDPNPIFPRHELHQFAYTAILLDRLGQHEDAKAPARRALAAASKTQSNAANHRSLGLATDGDKPLIRQLEKIVGDNPFAKAGAGARILLGKLKAAFGGTQ